MNFPNLYIKIDDTISTPLKIINEKITTIKGELKDPRPFE